MHITEDKNGKKYSVLNGYDICHQTLDDTTMKYLNRIMEIDTAEYGGDEKGEDCVYVGDVSGYIDRFGYDSNDRLDPKLGVVDNIIAIADPEQDNKILGYVNYLTVDDELYDEIIHPNIDAYLKDPSRRDDGISGVQLKPWSKTEPNNLFILSITMDHEYQDGEAIKVLTNEFLNELRNKQREGYTVSSITADTVSDHGEDAMKMFRCDCCKTEDGEPLILPAPESDESGHDVHVRICEGENMELLLSKGFDLNRERSGVNKHVEKKNTATNKLKEIINNDKQEQTVENTGLALE